MNLQALRIEAGWLVSYNQFYEVDPVSGYEEYFQGSSLLMLQNRARLRLIDVQWRPELDLNGEYQVQVLNFVEVFNSKTKEFTPEPNWENPFLIFVSKSRLELVEKLEELMRTLAIYEDPRIMKERGIIDEPSESYRLELKEKGISMGLVEKIVENGSDKIQNRLLDHKDLTREIILRLSEQGVNKKVKNKAQQKLRSAGFRK